MFPTEYELTDSASGIFRKILNWETIRRQFTEKVHARNALRARAGLHYSRLWPKPKMPFFANQILSCLKNP